MKPLPNLDPTLSMSEEFNYVKMCKSVDKMSRTQAQEVVKMLMKQNIIKDKAIKTLAKAVALGE